MAALIRGSAGRRPRAMTHSPDRLKHHISGFNQIRSVIARHPVPGHPADTATTSQDLDRARSRLSFYGLPFLRYA